jgi:hypothetical protein
MRQCANAMRMQIAINLFVRMRCECEFQFALPALVGTWQLWAANQKRLLSHLVIYLFFFFFQKRRYAWNDVNSVLCSSANQEAKWYENMLTGYWCVNGLTVYRKRCDPMANSRTLARAHPYRVYGVKECVTGYTIGWCPDARGKLWMWGRNVWAIRRLVSPLLGWAWMLWDVQVTRFVCSRDGATFFLFFFLFSSVHVLKSFRRHWWGATGSPVLSGGVNRRSHGRWRHRELSKSVPSCSTTPLRTQFGEVAINEAWRSRYVKTWRHHTLCTWANL